MIIPSPDPVCLVALGLTTLLALGAGQSEEAGVSLPAWLPVVGLAVFAIGSSVLGVLDPESFAAAFGAV